MAKLVARVDGHYATTGELMKRSWYWAVVLLLGVAIWCAVVATLQRPLVGDIQDDGEYFVAAQAIRDGRGYTLPSRPGAARATKYPPGLSLSAAAAMACGSGSFESDYLTVRIMMAGFGTLFIVASAGWLAAAGVPRGLAVGAALWSGFHRDVLELSSALMSDVPFAAVIAVTLWVWYSRARVGSQVALVLGVLCGYGILLRTTGIALAFGVGVGLVLRDRWATAAVYTAGLFAIVIPVQVWICTQPPPAVVERYTDDFRLYAEQSVSDSVVGVATRAIGYLRVPAEWVMPAVRTTQVRGVPGLSWVIVAATLILVVLGAAQVRRTTLHIPLAIQIVISVGLLIVWPWQLGVRGMLWLGPLCLVVIGVGFGVVYTWAVRRGVGFVAGAGGVAILTGYLVYGIASTRPLRTSRPDPGIVACLDYIRGETPREAVIVTFAPEMVYLHTGRQGAKVLLDADVVLGHAGDWSAAQAWMAVFPDRPFYLWGVDSGWDLPVYWQHCRNLQANAPYRLRRVFTSPDGGGWVDRIEPRSSGAGGD